MDRKMEIEMTKFIDMMVSRYSNSNIVYDKIADFIEYLNYTEALIDCSKEFKELFEEKILNAVVEGKEITFEKAYDCLINKRDLNLNVYKIYSGKHFDFNRVIGRLYGKSSSSVRDSVRYAASACGSSSSSSRCGSSSSSNSCHSSSSSRSSCGSSVSSSCGSSGGLSRC